MNESETLAAIRLALGREKSITLWRNNVGKCRDARGHIIQFGLCPGSSDLIGIRRVLITPEMVGQTFGQFTAVEVKAPGGTHPVTPEQRSFLNFVEAAGGCGIVARSASQAREMLGLQSFALEEPA